MTDQIASLAGYKQALRTFDWEYAHSDDQRVYRAGRQQHEALRAAQPQFDADFALWNAAAPAQYRRTHAKGDRT